VDAPTDAVARLEDGDVSPRAVQDGRSRQTGHPGPDDDDVLPVTGPQSLRSQTAGD
jgi:hypothetical protein